MKKILFPTDFSETAYNAFRYAVRLAEAMNIPITILHVLPPLVTSHKYYNADNELSLDEKRLVWTQEQLHRYKTQSDVQKVKTESVIETGNPINEINQYSSDYELIIMGSKGARNDKSKPLGSVARGVIQHALAPVMVIPEESPFYPYEHIMYASEKKMNTPDNLGFMAQLVDKFHPRISFTHIDQGGEEDKFMYEAVEQVYENENSSHQIGWYTFNQADVLSGLESFALNKEVDLIVMKTHERDLVGKVFDESLSEEMAQHTRIPLLVMK